MGPERKLKDYKEEIDASQKRKGGRAKKVTTTRSWRVSGGGREGSWVSGSGEKALWKGKLGENSDAKRGERFFASQGGENLTENTRSRYPRMTNGESRDESGSV